ncbi:MAG TPA: DUF1453 domain-containing protein [Candidatus Paceibacterota bacterium]|nr:DUF1453 domain-containing protein [Candidatus Paceibacterota bacterium]
MSSQHFATILIIGIFAWSIFRRVRRNIGRQKLRPRRAATSIIILSAISVLIVGTSLQNINLPLGFAAGLLPGALLGFLGLRFTRFETNADGHFYKPNTHIGIALSVLFVGRIAYRFMMLNNAAAAPNHPQAFQSPLTLFILGLYVGYYLVYQAGLLIHSRDKK